ncbi:MAG: DUF2779 domain-containing protein [Clostridia bacterium]|jgi:hypothetical protein|nr:DUF2779 domain-containing protein [Clostridia bacterium]
MGLSKSKLTRFCQCPKQFWLDENKRGLAEVSAAAEARFDEGTRVGELAKRLFGGFDDATVYDGDKLDLTAMIERTAELTAAGAENICEAAFSYGGCYCAVDILHRTARGYELYEVKSSAHVKQVYLIDVAYQRYVLGLCGVKLVGAYIVYINTDYVRRGDIDPRGLFRIQEVSAATDGYLAQMRDTVAAALDVADDPFEPTVELGERCASPYDCPYIGYCERDLPEPNVFDIYRMGRKKAAELYYNEGIASFDDVLRRGVKLSKMQKRQVESAANGLPTYVDRAGVNKFLAELWSPLYFLDFETFMAAIPPFDGLSPYKQVTFQYSLHYYDGEKLMHREFLGDGRTDPRRALAERLAVDIPTDACVLAYNKSFECSRLTELAELFPELADRLLKIRDNVRDLLDVFRGGYVYDKAMGGGFSIKKVLPALFAGDRELDYNALDGVHNGQEANETYMRLSELDGAEYETTRRQLLEYCKLDTLAMVKILEKIKELAK